MAAGVVGASTGAGASDVAVALGSLHATVAPMQGILQGLEGRLSRCEEAVSPLERTVRSPASPQGGAQRSHILTQVAGGTYPCGQQLARWG